MGLELLQILDGVVDEGETSGLSTTEMSAQAEDGNRLLVGLVELSQLAPEVILRDICEMIRQPAMFDVARI
jgi:hypothetical protein